MRNSFSLDPFQEESIRLAREGNSVIVSAPTGAGKTLIAERIIEDCMSKNTGVVYTAPIKALSNQKFRDFSRAYPEDVGILTGDVSINTDAAIVIMTTEIFRNSLLTDSERFKKRDWVIFDEIHYLDDIERGTVWEETIMLLPPHMRMLALSATIHNIDEFMFWLRSVHANPIKKIVETRRPVPLFFRFQCDNRFFESFSGLKALPFLKKNSSYARADAHKTKPNRLTTIISRLYETGELPCIYFSFSRRRCAYLAEELVDFDFLSSAERQRILSLYRSLLRRLDIEDNPTAQELTPLVSRGIAYHHAGLLPTLKEVIERLFATGLIKLIFATETFALGINMPAKTVIFDSLTKYYGRFHHYLKTRDLYQMAGRAGRRGIDNKGYVYLRINPLHNSLNALHNIMYGSYEPIRSQLRSSYATILNLYSLMGERLYDIYPRSFHFLQSNAHEKRAAVDLLKRKIALLTHMHYLVDGGLTQKAQLAAKVYSFELQIGELYEMGFLDDLDEIELFIVICALVYEPRKGERKPDLPRKARKLNQSLKSFTNTIHRQERRFRIYPLSKNFYFHMSAAAQRWYEGVDFYGLSRFCFADEGEIVRYFRMAIQVFREIKTSEIIDPAFIGRVSSCLKRINRDVIDAEKQLRQDL